MRILHVLGSLNRGGIETWLLRVLRQLDREQHAIDIAVQSNEHGAYEDDARRAGARVLRCLHPRQPWRYARNLRRLLTEHGPYDIVHSHNYLFSGLVLRVAARCGIPGRIAHICPHVDVKRDRPFRSWYRQLMCHWIARYAHCVLTPSQASLDAFRSICNCRKLQTAVVYSGVDISASQEPVDGPQVRRRYGLPPDDPLVIYVARFADHKNHAQLLRVADALHRQRPGIHFAMVGSHGPLLERFRDAASTRRHVTLLTDVADVAPLLQASDLFFFPSLNEGFGVVAVEAQAAGLPVVATDLPTVREAIDPAMHGLLISPNDDEAAIEHLRTLAGDKDRAAEASRCGRRFAEGFSIESSQASLLQMYQRVVARAA